MSNWISADDQMPKNCQVVEVKRLYRFKHYKKGSNQFKRGITGRWQEYNGYGWKNSEIEPTQWQAATNINSNEVNV